MVLRAVKRAILGVGLLLGAFPALAETLTVSSREIGRTVIVFPADAVRGVQLSGPIHGRDLGPLQVNRITRACLTLASSRGARVVYEPVEDRCRPLSSLPLHTRNRVLRLLGSLPAQMADSTSVIVRPAPSGTDLSCSCPPPPSDPPDVILNDGFEASPPLVLP